jgi:hypothetical protein
MAIQLLHRSAPRTTRWSKMRPHQTHGGKKMSDDCKHLHLDKLADNTPANGLHIGPEKAFYCRACGSTFFVNLEPATISVSYVRPPAAPDVTPRLTEGYNPYEAAQCEHVDRDNPNHVHTHACVEWLPNTLCQGCLGTGFTTAGRECSICNAIGVRSLRPAETPSPSRGEK